MPTNLAGSFHISDFVMHTVVGARGFVKETGADAGMAKVPVQTLIQASSHRPDAVKYEFDPQLYTKGPEAPNARIKELLAQRAV